MPHRVLVAMGAAVEEAVEGPEEPAQAAVQPARQQVARRAARLQQLGRQRGRQRQRVDGRGKVSRLPIPYAVVAVSHKCLATSHLPVLLFDAPNVKPKNRI
jgi:hypothetical protein